MQVLESHLSRVMLVYAAQNNHAKMQNVTHSSIVQRIQSIISQK